MDQLTQALVTGAVQVFPPGGPVVEIGSFQVPGQEAVSNVRPLFADLEYLGCDMREGPGVDRIERIEALTFDDASVGTLLCLNVVEHAWDFRTGIEEITRVVRPGGWALLTTAFNFDVHGFPDDYWRFTPRALERLFAGFEGVLYGWQGHTKSPRLVFVLGAKTALDDPAGRAAAWREAARAAWHERPSTWQRIGAGLGGSLFGKRYFRNIRHWWDLEIRPSNREPSA